MSSPPPTTSGTGTATATATATAVTNHRTNHCNSCNTDLSAGNTILCPHCYSHLPSNPNPNPNSSSIQSFINPFPPSSAVSDSSITSSDDNFRLDSPYLHRLIHHLRRTNASTSPSPRHSPTSKSAIESIPTVVITDSFLEIDPVVLCAVCKDQFVVDDETKELPCKHRYHPNCILPWLSQRNSCPLCRFQMPRETVSGCVKLRRRSRSRVLGFGDLMDDDDVNVDDEAMLGIGFSNLHEQHLQSENVVYPFTRIEQSVVDVDVVNDSEMENGVVNESWSGFNLSRIRGSNGWIDASDDDDDGVEMP